jgi:hypothetical protein
MKVLITNANIITAEALESIKKQIKPIIQDGIGLLVNESREYYSFGADRKYLVKRINNNEFTLTIIDKPEVIFEEVS